MEKYAMVLLNKVIDMVESNVIPNYPPDPRGNPVMTIKCDDSVYIGMIYDFNKGAFTEYVPPRHVPTEQEIINGDILLNQADIISKQTEQDKVLAELLLNQIGG